MFFINKIVFIFLNPLMLGLLGLLAGAILTRIGWRKCATAAKVAAVVWLWFWFSIFPSRWIGCPLESHYPPRPMSEIPTADAIVVLGGGMAGHVLPGYGAEMFASADRAWCAARLWKAGKAPAVIPTGTGVAESEAVFLANYGIPNAAIWSENVSRNTEENIKFTAKLLHTKLKAEKPRILLVTSAWHMRRAMLFFAKYAPEVEVVPVATDYEHTLANERRFSGRDFLPDADAFARNTALFKELLGYWGYRLLR